MVAGFSSLTFIRAARAVALLVALTLAPAYADEPPFAGPFDAGQLAAPPKQEASGLAASRRSADVLWTHDDSGGAPAVYAVGIDGALRGTLRVNGVRNDDWEDIASADLDGRSWLLIGDIGDNNAKRRDIAAHFIEEPTPDQLAPDREHVAAPAATLRIVFEDGPRDCESLAVDPTERAIYLLSKRDDVPRLYRVAIPAPLKSADVSARFVGLVSQLPKPTGLQALMKGHLGRHRGWPTAMDFAPDGSAAVVLTYGDVLIFPRRKGESWPSALANEPIVLGAHGLPQAEGVCFSRDGTQIFVASEILPTLLRYERRK